MASKNSPKTTVIRKSKVLPAADGKTNFNLTLEYTAEFQHGEYYGSSFRFLDDSCADPILATSCSLYWASRNIVGVADSNSAEEGEIAYQLFDAKRLPTGHLLTLSMLCERAFNGPEPEDYDPFYDEPSIQTEVFPFFKAHEKDTPQIIGVLFELLGEAVDELLRDVFHEKEPYRPIYVAFLVGPEECYHFENSMKNRIRRSVPSITTIGIGENTMAGSEDCTVLYHKLERA